jgi:hypothetical protein
VASKRSSELEHNYRVGITDTAPGFLPDVLHVDIEDSSVGVQTGQDEEYAQMRYLDYTVKSLAACHTRPRYIPAASHQ